MVAGFLWLMNGGGGGGGGVVVVVVGVIVAVADGRVGCGWCCECFLGNGLYYFIVWDILFYCDVYIILLC